MNEKNLKILETLHTYGEYFDTFFKVKDNPKRLVARILNIHTGDMINSVVIPTSLYPLHNNDFDIFTNKSCTEITDKKVLKIFDSVEYQVGRCYTMADELKEKLVKAGYDAKIYTGWMFAGCADTPMHHAWVVLDGNVLDIQDHYSVLYGMNGDIFKDKTTDECRELISDFHMYCQKNGISNSERCHPVGVPSDLCYYIGCEVDCAQRGRDIYNRLVEEYPQYYRYEVSKTQRMIQDKMK